MLGLTAYEPLPPLELTPSGTRRSPIVALLLSMLFPGLGHLYVGLRRHALWLIASQAIAIAFVAYGSGNLHGEAILVVISLYCFAIADAYFSAREWNAGATTLLTGGNPRIAAILNLLTKGFGYFYIGDRTKGIACFFVVSAVQFILLIRTNVWTSILAITIQIAISADGYRVARERLLADHPKLDHSEDGGPGAISRANPGGLGPVPASIFFVGLAMVAVLGYAALRALNGTSITTIGTLEQGPSGILYRNSVEHIELTAPRDWEYTRPADSLAQLTADNGSSVIVMLQYSIAAVDSTIEATEASILKRHSDATFITSETNLGSRQARNLEATFTLGDGRVLHQRYVACRRGFKVVFLIETWTSDEERLVLDNVEKTVRI